MRILTTQGATVLKRPYDGAVGSKLTAHPDRSAQFLGNGALSFGRRRVQPRLPKVVLTPAFRASVEPASGLHV
ncbi:MAG TPA: hypothetical protein VJA21_00290 [Verrucomicrobiae bacterium]